jgi:hypothetical protein
MKALLYELSVNFGVGKTAKPFLLNIVPAMSFEIRRNEKWDRAIGICFNAGREEPDHGFNKTKH